MFYDVSHGHGLPHDPVKALIAPRPIGWICALSAKGEVNLSPYSFFNQVSDRPHMVMFSSAGQKDAVTFVQETGEFTCSIVSWDQREAMNRTSAPLPRGHSEFVHAGLEPEPSKLVRPPHVRGAPAALECKLVRTIDLVAIEGGEAAYIMAIGQVVGVHIDDRVMRGGYVDTAMMQIVSR
ncbi:MAG: flavin reductase family protein, partial [Gemmatimonadaceae bacterium]|nr:flavin reductase family protein [Acetobacteraceae bacterium]